MAERSLDAGRGRITAASSPLLRRLAQLRTPSPVALLVGAVLVCAGLLTLPLILPLGPMYWDLALYLDAANRIESGQLPLIDFFTPVGPLGYWLFAWLGDLFPNSQPLLLAQWSIFAVTAPPMALILREVDRRSRALAFGLLLPYLAFQILPINVEQYSFFPGLDGYGIYNRQVSIILYVMVAALACARGRRLVTGVLVWTMLALLLVKVTGFLAGGLICAFALLAGRVSWRQALAAAGIAGLLLAALEAANGMVSAYVESILALLAMNAGSILSRFLQAGSLHLDIVGAGAALIATLVILTWREIRTDAAALWRERSAASLAKLLDRDLAWLAVVMAAGLFFETQNTGGQAFIFAWPVLLVILLRWIGRPGRGATLVLVLVAATAIPPAATVLHRAGRALLAQTNYVPLPHRHLGRLGLVSQNREVMARAEAMREIYAAAPGTYRAIAAEGMLPGYSLYSDLDFQAGWLMAIDEAVTEILRYEAGHGTRFETIMSLNFANPFPYLMDRTGVRHIAIGADPARAVPPADAQTLEAIRAADLILHPQCPITVANETLLARYRPAMAGRREIALGPCWKGYVKGE
jgi:hypothetical protein